MGFKETMKKIGQGALGIATGGITDRVFDLLDSRGLSPEAKAELTKVREENEQELAKIEADAIAREVEAAASIIRAEAQSQSWLARNSRPLFLFMGTILIFLNYSVPLFSQFGVAIAPVPLPDWFYQTFSIGFSGYVLARSFDKHKAQ